jgi:hypothetical protein
MPHRQPLSAGGVDVGEVSSAQLKRALDRALGYRLNQPWMRTLALAAVIPRPPPSSPGTAIPGRKVASVFLCNPF